MSPGACSIDPMRSLTPSTNPLVGVLVVAESKAMVNFGPVTQAIARHL